MLDAPAPRPRLSKDRKVFIRRHGDGFTDTVEPHPSNPGNYQSLNRRFENYATALAYATSLREKQGWPIADETRGGLGVVKDPKRPEGRATVFLHQHPGGLCPVILSPPPWGCRQAITECASFGAAYALAVRLSRQYADRGGSLAIVVGKPT